MAEEGEDGKGQYEDGREQEQGKQKKGDWLNENRVTGGLGGRI